MDLQNFDICNLDIFFQLLWQQSSFYYYNLFWGATGDLVRLKSQCRFYSNMNVSFVSFWIFSFCQICVKAVCAHKKHHSYSKRQNGALWLCICLAFPLLLFLQATWLHKRDKVMHSFTVASFINAMSSSFNLHSELKSASPVLVGPRCVCRLWELLRPLRNPTSYLHNPLNHWHDQF